MITAIEKLGSIPKWPTIEAAAKETCEACSISDMASDSVCKECPAVDLIKRLVRRVNSEKAEEDK